MHMPIHAIQDQWSSVSRLKCEHAARRPKPYRERPSHITGEHGDVFDQDQWTSLTAFDNAGRDARSR
jgi:hypothetical protein